MNLTNPDWPYFMAKNPTKPFGMMEIKSTFVFIYIGELLEMITIYIKMKNGMPIIT